MTANVAQGPVNAITPAPILENPKLLLLPKMHQESFLHLLILSLPKVLLYILYYSQLAGSATYLIKILNLFKVLF